MPFFGIVGVEDNLTAGGTGRGGQTARDLVSTGQSALVEDGVQEFVELVGLAALDGGFLVDEAFVKEVHGDLHHCGTRALTVTRLEEPEFAFLYRELHVLHVAIVLLELVLQGVEFLVDFGHGFFHGGELGSAFFFADTGTFCPTLCTDLGDLLRRADTGYHVFTLCVYQILTVEEVLTVTGVAAEANTRCRGFAHVTEHHGLYVHSRTPLVGDRLHLTIENGALVHPAAEYRANGTPKLFFGICGEVVAGLCFDGGLEALNEIFQFFDREILVEVNAANGLHFLDDGFEGIDVFLVLGLHAEHDVTVHLHEATIGVVYEVGVAGFCHQTFGHLVVETEVEDGVHHTGHRCARTGTHGEQQRISGVAKLAVHAHFRCCNGGCHGIGKFGNDGFLTYAVIIVARFGGDGKPGRNGHANLIHLGEVGTFTTEQITHRGVALGFSVAECVNSFYLFHIR